MKFWEGCTANRRCFYGQRYRLNRETDKGYVLLFRLNSRLEKKEMPPSREWSPKQSVKRGGRTSSGALRVAKRIAKGNPHVLPVTMSSQH